MCFELDENEYLFIYNSQILQDREAAGYIRTLKEKEINDQDVTKDMLTETQVVAAAQMLNVDLNDMIRSDTKADENFSQEELLKLLKKQPTLLRTPFVLSKHRSFFIESPLNLIKEQF